MTSTIDPTHRTSGYLIRVLSCAGLVLAALGLALPAAEDADDATTTNLPEEQWPIGFKLPKEMVTGWKKADRIINSNSANVLVWTPPKAKHLRALFLISPNTDSKNIGMHEPLRQVCAEQDVGIVYLRHIDGSIVERSDPPEQAKAFFDRVMSMVAERSGFPEAAHAPWITLGKSSRGRFPFRTTWWFPERVVASISYHGETPTWPMADWSKAGDENVLHVAINGLTEWDGTWYRHVRPALLNYHHHTGWLAHQLVLYGVGHGNYIDMHGSEGWGMKVPGKHISTKRIWSYIGAFIGEAMRLRVPADTYATDGPIDLQAVERSAGYLIHPRAIEELLGLKWFAFRQDDAGIYQTIKWPDETTPVYDSEQGTIPAEQLIRPASAIPEDERADYLWIPSRSLAKNWLSIHDLYKQSDKVLPKE